MAQFVRRFAKSDGFTLIELMIAAAVASGILFAILKG
jgi:prepilin-type N-terminal cleavage/methylation domain-containing protein